jgi:hypothetical protein
MIHLRHVADRPTMSRGAPPRLWLKLNSVTDWHGGAVIMYGVWCLSDAAPTPRAFFFDFRYENSVNKTTSGTLNVSMTRSQTPNRLGRY